MYRPNRIGPWPVVNFELPPIELTMTDFNSVDHANHAFGMFSPNVVVPESLGSETILFDSDTNIAANSSAGIGIQVNGASTQHDYIWSISAQLSAVVNDGDVDIDLCIGRLDAVPSASSSVIVTNAKYVPCTKVRDSGQIYIHANLEIVGQREGQAQPSPEHPIGLFFHIVNETVGPKVTSQMKIQLNLQKYLADLITFDPSR